MINGLVCLLDLEPLAVKKHLIRWMFILRMHNSGQELFFPVRSVDFETQVYKDMDGIDKSRGIIDYIYDKMSINHDILSTANPIQDEQITIRGSGMLVYESRSLDGIFDPCIRIQNGQVQMKYYARRSLLENNLPLSFCQYLRYKYIYANNQTLAYHYSGPRTQSIECFGSPFNHYFNIYFSAFYEDFALGASGEFFNCMKDVIDGKMELPCRDLKVNPPFDEIAIQRMAEVVLQLLRTSPKYTVSCILPDWENLDGKDMLLCSDYLDYYEVFRKYDIQFRNYFIGKVVSPCGIIIMHLKN